MQVIVCTDAGIEMAGIGRSAKPMSRTVSLRELGEYRAARGRKGKAIEPRWKDTVLSLPRSTPSLF
jgi:hypothetical protein